MTVPRPPNSVAFGPRGCAAIGEGGVERMSSEAPQRPSDDFDARLRKLRGQVEGRSASGDAGRGSTGYGFAFGLAADMLGGLVGGGLIGWALDAWLGTAPWGMTAMVVLGAVAGMYGVYKSASARTKGSPAPRSGGAEAGEDEDR